MIKLDRVARRKAVKSLLKPNIFRTLEEQVNIYLYQNERYIENKKRKYLKINERQFLSIIKDSVHV